jgi:hypothetical protein
MSVVIRRYADGRAEVPSGTKGIVIISNYLK